MGQYRTILLIADPELENSAAIARGTSLARATGATLHLCVIDYNVGVAAFQRVDEPLSQSLADVFVHQRMAWLRKQCGLLEQEGIRCEFSVVWGHPVQQMILAKVMDMQPDLVLKDVHAVPALARVFYTPVDWHLLRLCPAPLMLVNSHAHALPRRIIATVDPVDGSRDAAELNERVIQSALALAIQCDAELHALHAFALLPNVGEALAYADLHQRLRDAHLRAFDELMERHSVPPDRRHFVEHVFPDAAIAEFAREHQTDVVVMGTTYRSAVDRFLMGSTAERTLYRLKCDVLALKPKGFLVDAAHWFNATVNQGIHYAQDAA